jgi:putative transposase
MRILVVVDDCTRECLAVIADPPASSIGCSARRGKPKTIVSDNGTELTSNAILRWADDHNVAWHYIARASRCRMLSPKTSSAACGTSCVTRPSFPSLPHTRAALEG